MALEPVETSLASPLERAIAGMRAARVDALLLTPGADLFYLTGFEHGHAMERLLALIVRSDGLVQWLVPAMNVPQVEPFAREGQAVRGWTDAEGYLEPLASALGGARTIAFDDEARAAFLMDLMGVAPGAALRPASSILRGLRIRKTPREIAALRAVARQVDETIAEAIALCRPGVSEAEVDRALRAALLRRDVRSAVAFTIIASGPNSALPHHETAGRTLRRGDVVILDFGTRGSVVTGIGDATHHSQLFGYQSDITVTCGVGEPGDSRVREVYPIVWEAQQSALAAARPGATCQEIDRAARSVIESAGYGAFFPHRTGHGLGLSGHEPPYLRTGSPEPLEEGMVFTIEPGIYLPGHFGVRLEVVALATARGAELLNAPSAREIPISPAQ